MRRLSCWLGLLALGGCAAGPPIACRRPAAGAGVAYVVDHGWHTDIAIPAAELSGPAAVFRSVFPGARALVFGFGKRTFFTAKVESWREYLLGPFPGPAAILATGLSVMPDAAYGPADTVRLALPPGGAQALSAFLWREVAKDRAGRPRLIAAGPYPGSLFYAAAATYRLARTCNAWTAEALRAAGAPVSPAGVILAGQVMRRARQASMCPMPPAPALAIGSGPAVAY